MRNHRYILYIFYCLSLFKNLILPLLIRDDFISYYVKSYKTTREIFIYAQSKNRLTNVSLYYRYCYSFVNSK